MSDAVDIWQQRRLDAEALIEQAQELEEAANDPQLSIEEVNVFYSHANNLRLRALCMLDGTTRAVEPEDEPEE